MSGEINKIILPITRPMPSIKQDKPLKQNDASKFGTLFEQEVFKQTEVKFSKHAMERFQSRGISLTKEDIKKINDAVNKAAEKGVRETLILMKDVALIANVKNKTVITATTDESLKNNVFTNIDGAVII